MKGILLHAFILSKLRLKLRYITAFTKAVKLFVELYALKRFENLTRFTEGS